MKILETPLKDVFIIEPDVFGDERGWFFESWSEQKMLNNGFNYNFVQDNHSFSSKKGTLRGLHCQIGDFAQAKLVRCARGAVLDVAVDVREGSPTFKKWTSVVLSKENFRQFLIPRGFLHGFLTLTNDVEFLYKADNGYCPESDRSVLWSDPDISIDWNFSAPIISEKDKNAPFLIDSDIHFVY
ncbi:MAG: dTDP-4-dehydrorhamnose 3,5-epimerase [Oscillospiraceae bacterium]